MTKQKVRSDMILRQLRKRHVGKANLDDVFLTEVKNGRSWDNRNLLILDALGIRKSWTKPCFTGYEVKVDRGDFMRDQKWSGYLQYCHEFYFACPAGLIKPEELPSEVGLIYYNPEKDCISTKRKALHRPIELSTEMLMYIIMAKFDSDRHPFFSNRREMLQAIIEDKKDRKTLGSYVARKTADYIEELQTERGRVRKLENDSDTLAEIKKVMMNHGLNTYWDLSKALDKALTYSMDPKLVDKVTELGRVATELDKLVQDQAG